MDEIFENLERQILKCPKNAKIYCKDAKEKLEDMMCQQNYSVFENLVKELKTVDTVD
jgi:hypothetical protein